MVSLAEAHDQFVLDTIQALGVTKAERIADYFCLSKTDAKATLKRLAQRDRAWPSTMSWSFALRARAAWHKTPQVGDHSPRH